MRIFWRKTIFDGGSTMSQILRREYAWSVRGMARKPVCPDKRTGERSHKAFEEVVGSGQRLDKE